MGIELSLHHLRHDLSQRGVFAGAFRETLSDPMFDEVPKFVATMLGAAP
jgi:hypothetical protein